MPGTPKPVGANGALPTIWNALVQKLQSHDTRIAALEGAHTPSIFDQFGNVFELSGTNLQQTVTIGAAYTQPGVRVGTGLTGTGRAKQTSLATGTITLTAGSTAATLVTTTSGTFTSGQVIGAANVSDPSSGMATPAIVPGTTFTITGSAITLSAPAAESGTAIYAASATFTRL